MIITIVGFSSIILAISGNLLLGWKNKYAFLILGLSNLLWCWIAYKRSPLQIDLFAINLIFFIIAIRNFYLWQKSWTPGK